MADPFSAILAFQQAILESWLSSTAMVMRSWEQLFELNERLVGQADRLARSRVEIDDGPTFTGKYGKRHLDIDPERDV
ncbi:hypothetical protein [Magnetospirillum molischianum]|uniref:Uncharacterized protein n=1 Tax=Magnetospirillum molischianum DSM 120 TaxID=1150626 RepID=H8FW83_MAGML|nr:hypothetical protein [Magnetospirillum molischianum]CCG42621.1 conserved hypothetical protein [Magnetospirillum molischianum DSM 120]